MVELSKFMADTVLKNPDNFRVFGPDETKSNRLFGLFDVTKRQW
ncbi:Xylulose-5-phosphate phosphoketolase, partial [Metamycoplasma alkalescens]